MEKLNEIDEIRQDVNQRNNLVQQKISRWCDKYIKKRKFHPGYQALLFDSKFKDFQGKFQTHWLGPYEIETIFDNGVVRIRTIEEERTTFIMNGHRLRIYHKSLIKYLQDNTGLKLVKKDFPYSPT